MRCRALQIGLALFLVIGVSGLAPLVAEAAAAGEASCCSDCEDADCPEEQGEECPPRCDDCVCPCWVAPVVVAAASQPPPRPAPREVAFAAAEVTREPPVLRGVFRPPRLSV